MNKKTSQEKLLADMMQEKKETKDKKISIRLKVDDKNWIKTKELSQQKIFELGLAIVKIDEKKRELVKK